MIKITPSILNVLSIHITHKEQEFLLLIIKTTEFFSQDTLELSFFDDNHLNKQTIFTLKAYYNSHQLDDVYIYKYIAYDQFIFESYLKQYKSPLQLDYIPGFFYVDPNNHEISIDPLITNTKDLITFNNNRVITVQEIYNSPRYNICVNIHYPKKEIIHQVSLPIPENMYVFFDLLLQQSFIKITYNNINNEIQYNLKCNLNLKEQKIMIFKYHPIKNGKDKQINIFIDSTESNISPSTIEEVVKNAHAFHNRENILTLTLKQIPVNLSLKNYILWCNKFYKIIEIAIDVIKNNITCTIIAVYINPSILENKVYIIYENNIVDLPKIDDILMRKADNQIVMKNHFTLENKTLYNIK